MAFKVGSRVKLCSSSDAVGTKRLGTVISSKGLVSTVKCDDGTVYYLKYMNDDKFQYDLYKDADCTQYVMISLRLVA